MKKLTAALLCVSLLFLSGCAVKAPKVEKLVAVSFYPVYIFTLNITDGIEGLDVECMAEQATGCLHDYTVTAKDARLLNDCDAYIINGAGMEGFIEDLYETAENLKIIDSSAGVNLICSGEHETGEHTVHHHHHGDNSHIWMSVANAFLQAENICNGVSEIFHEYEEVFLKNKSEYIKKLNSLQSEIQDAKSQVRGESVITFHNAYQYLFDDLGINILTTIESDEGGEPSAKALGSVADKIKKEKINSLFVEPAYEGSAAEILSNETGAEVYVLNPVLKGENKKSAYEDIMRNNLQIILKAVK